MKPYGLKNASDMEHVFAYSLSSFRRISENVFGIWSNRFWFFSKRALLTPDKTVIAIKASLATHNIPNQVNHVPQPALLISKYQMAM